MTRLTGCALILLLATCGGTAGSRDAGRDVSQNDRTSGEDVNRDTPAGDPRTDGNASDLRSCTATSQCAGSGLRDAICAQGQCREPTTGGPCSVEGGCGIASDLVCAGGTCRPMMRADMSIDVPADAPPVDAPPADAGLDLNRVDQS